MKTIASYAAMIIVDLEQDNIEILDTDCDWLNPARRIFCTEFKAVRGDTLFNAVTPGNIWESHERDGRADRIPAALERADQHGHENTGLILTPFACLTSPASVRPGICCEMARS